jgi:hypothetical protein
MSTKTKQASEEVWQCIEELATEITGDRDWQRIESIGLAVVSAARKGKSTQGGELRAPQITDREHQRQVEGIQRRAQLNGQRVQEDQA